jgi:hypothetical protein
MEIFPMTATTRTSINGQQRKTLASQIDRLDGILDGLDAALAGAVQEAVEQAVKQAVQTVLTEVLTNRELQQQLQQAAQPALSSEPPRSKNSTANRLWLATTEAARQTVQKMKQLGRGVGMALVAAGGVVAGLVYAARRQIAAATSTVYRNGKRLVQGALAALTSFLPSFAFSE